MIALSPTAMWVPERGAALALSALVGAWAPMGCAAEGSVEIVFLLPESESLSPIAGNLAEITVVSTVPGEPPRSEARHVTHGSEEVNIGSVKIADGVTLAVELRSPSKRLIGYGRSAGPIDIEAEGVTEVPIMLRRPFAYATGGGARPCSTRPSTPPPTNTWRRSPSRQTRSWSR
jgi:hypothetical protein